ncbi:hypothetical protein H6F47_09180 [Sphaerospermopsis sp. FACHB-1094]|uniref:hypothetical protein n=1 Tax=Sphaerospermopsis sp. FACHB-1094 TaxID=2692861 RepID=UPI001684C328|nr:hypothetical protein [Sphaerospermopsis sp. FACHB-1094]MBD2132594.1 hypothetical protein [Sphaerospermopsis sp. FACHB-1094]
MNKIKKPKGWYQQITIRPTLSVDGYENYEKICSYVADVYFSVDEPTAQQLIRKNDRDSRGISFYTLFKVGQAKCPAYWVGKDLLAALIQSDLTIEADSLNWAMKTGILMLPKNVVMSPENHSVYAILWHYDTDEELIYLTAMDKASYYCRRFKVFDNLRQIRYTDVEDVNPKILEDFNEYLESIFLRLMLIMECCPELVDTTSEVVRVNRGFSKAQEQEFYQPLWIGRNYTFKREQTAAISGGTGGAKSVHWRRGFLRNQPYGEGRQQRKMVWIEPVLVMGGRESS